MEEMVTYADPADLASAMEANFTQAAIQAVREKAQASTPGDTEFDGVHCVCCGAAIPDERLAALKTVRCVDCQTATEKRGRMFR